MPARRACVTMFTGALVGTADKRLIMYAAVRAWWGWPAASGAVRAGGVSADVSCSRN